MSSSPPTIGRSAASEAACFAVRFPAGAVELEGELRVPDGAAGVVVFAHGSGSGRNSPRNRAVAAALRARGLATMLIDLLTDEEEAIDERTRHLRFDIGLLASRLVGAVEWIAARHPGLGGNQGLFGASTGAGAVLVAASRRPDKIVAVVSRGGRPDLAGPYLGEVRCPTLLIVGGRDGPVIELNRDAMARMNALTRLEIIPGATHLFEEPGMLDKVAQLAGDWFTGHMWGGKGAGSEAAEDSLER